MKLAYADPPYPGHAALYRDHPDYAGEVDHAELIGRLCRDYPDGWALSTGGPEVQQVLALCPDDVRVAIWHRTNAYPPPGNIGWHWQWEPLIVRGGRPMPAQTVLSCGFSGRAERFIGGKPAAFTRWMLALLGAETDDQIDDLFPGSGAVTDAILSWRRQPVLPSFRVSQMVNQSKHPARLVRDLTRNGEPGLFGAGETVSKGNEPGAGTG